MNYKKIGLLTLLVLLLSSSLFLILFSQKRIVVLEKLEKRNASGVSFNPTPPTLKAIFSDNHSWTATLSAKHLTTVIATGDIIPARTVNWQVTRMGNFTWPYEKTADVLKSADITFVNLETPLLSKCPTTVEGMIFCGSDRNVEGLVFSGVDVASLANNHAGNHGIEGIQETIALLERNGIAPTGVGKPVYKEVRGVRFAFLGFNQVGAPERGIAWASPPDIQKQIKEARKNADVVIVTYHWGNEYVSEPDPIQVELGHLSIDSGADLVIGNHPHWVKPIEIYKGKLITYAHGNFVFDQEWSEKTKEGVVGKYTFYQNALIDIEYLPIRIVNYGQPYFAKGEEKEKILEEMKKESLKLAQ